MELIFRDWGGWGKGYLVRTGHIPDRLNRGTYLTLHTWGAWTYNELMAWKTSSVMDEKLRFVFYYERDEQTMRELCASFGITRETGYVWLRRYRQ